MNNTMLQWQTVLPDVVYRSIAEAALSRTATSAGPEPLRMGGVALHAHQQDAVHRLETAMQLFGGALLADTVGLGKTYVALAVARNFRQTHIVAPANLLPMWRAAIAATGASNVSLHSLHTMSRRSIPNPDLVPSHGRLVVFDEAHHLRTRNTNRYRHAAQFVSGCTVLVMSATPLHNRTRDLHNLLALFMGHRADLLDNDTLEKCIVRRTAEHVPSVILPSVNEHPPHILTDNPPVLEAILTLPAPLPPHNGAAASALVKLGLLRAWCSSDAALKATIRRRQLRGEALLHSLQHGRYPTQRELQSWIVGTDSIQLGFPELLVAATTVNTAMLATLTRHLDGLQRLLQLHTSTARADAERAAMLRLLLEPGPNADQAIAVESGKLGAEAKPALSPASTLPIIAFSRFASTVRALHRALSDVAGVASVTSQGGRIAGGPIARHELIARFAPRAHSRPPPPAHERIRLLLTTDMLAEGVNLQDAGTLVHLDLPWTDAARAQRVGRLARIGSEHQIIHVHAIAPPAGAERVLRIVKTLQRKAQLSDSIIGSPTQGTNSPEFETAAECASRLRTRMLQWASLPICRPVEARLTPVASVRASETGWIAVVCRHAVCTVIAHAPVPCARFPTRAFESARTVM